MKFRRVWRCLCVSLLFVGGCAHLASPEEKEISYKRFQSITINGEGLSDFLQERTGIIVAGAEPALVANRAHDVDIRLKPVANDGFDIGSTTAIATDGYFLTAAHCVSRRPLYVLLPSETGAKILAARLVWSPPAGSACDVAILKVDILFHPAFVVAEDREIQPGFDVVTAGANGLAGGKILGVQPLLIKSSEIDQPGVQAVSHTAPLAEGDSGGPLTTSDGHLIGIEVLARGELLSGPQGIALRPDASWMREKLQKDRKSIPATMPAAHP